MTRRRGRSLLAVAVVLAGFLCEPAMSEDPTALAPPPPAPDPGSPDRNIFYGATPPFGERAPVLVFVPGVHGTAEDWFVQNDMYAVAFRAQYRTAFVSLNADNTPNDAAIHDNSLMLRDLLPKIAARFDTRQLYLIGHSKGAVDVQAAMLDPWTARLVKSVFTISSPHWGSELADWAFDHPGLAVTFPNLLTPAVASLQTGPMTAFRSLADPILQATGVPFYTLTGDRFTGDPVTSITGLILRTLAPGKPNDGFVTVERSLLPAEYSSDLGTVHTNHFGTDSGQASFAKIDAVIQGRENTLNEFRRVAVAGLGDPRNTWVWSMAWFKGKLYVGTGREVDCMTFLTSDVQLGTSFYPLLVAGGHCPDVATFARSLAAEIWSFDPDTNVWKRVFKSPQVLPMVMEDGQLLFTGRDMGFRGMTVFRETDGTEALYVGGVTAGSAFEHLAPYNGAGFPPPRLLRSVDGEHWTPVPQAPGTFLGDLGKPLPGNAKGFKSFRALTPYKGKLFATVGDFRGVGVIIASNNPAAGNDAWFLASSPSFEAFPVWNLHVFNGFLYCATGLEDAGDGYGVYKTDAAGFPPYRYAAVVTNGGFQTNPALRSPNGLSFGEFQGRLYMGTNRPTELIAINPDDSWDLVVGEPRSTPVGFKAPLSGFGSGFGSRFNGHFWRMATYNGQLYLSTWDWSVGAQALSPTLDAVFGYQYGFDFYRTSDGVHWTAVSRTGLGDPHTAGGRTLVSTPAGLFVGTSNSRGTQVFQGPVSVTGPVGPPAPLAVEAVSELVSGRKAILSWQPSPGAVRYRIYRSAQHPLTDFLPGTFSLNVLGTDRTVTLEDIQAGGLDSLCPPPSLPASTVVLGAPCAIIDELRALRGQEGGFPTRFVLVGITTLPVFVEDSPTLLQSVYFVRAEDAEGNLSEPSNIVGAPSKALPGSNTTASAAAARLSSPPFSRDPRQSRPGQR